MNTTKINVKTMFQASWAMAAALCITLGSTSMFAFL
jgi:hypothetical protein